MKRLKRALKITGIVLAILLILVVFGFTGFVYKARYGFPFYDTKAPALPELEKGTNVLVFSKTNGFRHGEAIEASRKAFDQLAKAQGWGLFQTENGAVFNPEQLARFDVVVWNNVTGPVLNEEQRTALRQYVEGGGGFVGIHGAGDNSHEHWGWYTDTIIRARFSHHPMNPQLQEAELHLEQPDSIDKRLAIDMPEHWTRTDEWYVFHDNPRDRGAQVLYTVDENTFDPNGNIGFLVRDKDWGMGADHPVSWYSTAGEGRVFYTAMGHSGSAFREEHFLQLLENAIMWAGDSILQSRPSR